VVREVFFGFTFKNDFENPCGREARSVTIVAIVGAFLPYSVYIKERAKLDT